MEDFTIPALEMMHNRDKLRGLVVRKGVILLILALVNVIERKVRCYPRSEVER